MFAKAKPAMRLNVVAYACNPSTWEAEGLGVQGNQSSVTLYAGGHLELMGTCVKKKNKGKAKTASSCTSTLTRTRSY